jgi:hypothetical protein
MELASEAAAGPVAENGDRLPAPPEKTDTEKTNTEKTGPEKSAPGEAAPDITPG